MLLSYDATILAIALHAHLTPQCDRIKCVGCKQQKQQLFSGENWKKVAAVNFLLAAEKLHDDIEDERSLKAALGGFVFRKCIRKAKADYPEIDEAIRSGYADIMALEKENASVLQIADAFVWVDVKEDQYRVYRTCAAKGISVNFYDPCYREDTIAWFYSWLRDKTAAPVNTFLRPLVCSDYGYCASLCDCVSLLFLSETHQEGGTAFG